MRHARLLAFDDLEARQLLSRTHVAVAHKVAARTAPLVLNGTLLVDNATATTVENDDGSLTTNTPVAGSLGSVGEVHGQWNENVDAYGDYQGPDTITLHSPKGTFVIAFNDGNRGKPQKIAGGAVEYQVRQQLAGGSGSFAKATESGTIELTTTSARNGIATLTITSKSA